MLAGFVQVERVCLALFTLVSVGVLERHTVSVNPVFRLEESLWYGDTVAYPLVCHAE